MFSIIPIYDDDDADDSAAKVDKDAKSRAAQVKARADLAKNTAKLADYVLAMVNAQAESTAKSDNDSTRAGGA